MIFRPSIYHGQVTNSNTQYLTKIRIKDTEKINKIIELCKEICINYTTIEDAKEPITRVVITIPYKEITE